MFSGQTLYSVNEESKHGVKLEAAGAWKQGVVFIHRASASFVK